MQQVHIIATQVTMITRSAAFTPSRRAHIVSRSLARPRVRRLPQRNTDERRICSKSTKDPQPYVPSDSFGGQSPERKASTILRTFFTFVAARYGHDVCLIHSFICLLISLYPCQPAGLCARRTQRAGVARATVDTPPRPHDSGSHHRTASQTSTCSIHDVCYGHVSL